LRIAFDLDDTLIGCRYDFPAEPRRRCARLLAREPLRRGTVRLLRRLATRGHDLWIYTTSQRSPLAIRLLFLAHGVRLGGVVNGLRHHKEIARSGRDYQHCSKYPPHFGIDLLIDDLEGMAIEARRHGYRVLVVRPDDERWAETLVAQIDRICGPRASRLLRPEPEA
jgi:hypothetical protein